MAPLRAAVFPGRRDRREHRHDRGRSDARWRHLGRGGAAVADFGAAGCLIPCLTMDLVMTIVFGEATGMFLALEAMMGRQRGPKMSNAQYSTGFLTSRTSRDQTEVEIFLAAQAAEHV
jgi:hypothetical protein